VALKDTTEDGNVNGVVIQLRMAKMNKDMLKNRKFFAHPKPSVSSEIQEELEKEIEHYEHELNLCLSEQGFDWYPDEDNFIGYMLLGLISAYEDKIKKLAKQIQNEREMVL
jgi:hypothetical protein